MIKPGILAALLALTPAIGAQAQDQPGSGQEQAFRTTTLELAADGRVEVAPDLATVRAGVRADGPTASAALDGQRRRMSDLIAALRAIAIPDRDLQTTELALEPQYVDDGKSPRRLSGYTASNTLSVRLHGRDARIGPVVDALVAAGADRIEDIGFGLDDPTAAQDAARRLAAAALQSRAELYAQATGYHVRRLVRLSEGDTAAPQPMAMPMMAVRRMATPVAPGELTVQVGLSAVYELAR